MPTHSHSDTLGATEYPLNHGRNWLQYASYVEEPLDLEPDTILKRVQHGYQRLD